MAHAIPIPYHPTETEIEIESAVLKTVRSDPLNEFEFKHVAAKRFLETPSNIKESNGVRTYLILSTPNPIINRIKLPNGDRGVAELNEPN